MPWNRPEGSRNICPKCYFYVKEAKTKKAKLKLNRAPESENAPLRGDLSERSVKSIRDPSLLSEEDRAEPKD
jgi:hypothetical protein